MSRRGSVARASGGTALLALDVFSDFRFVDGAAMCERLRTVAPALGTLIRRARRAEVPVVYVNDHSGHWRATFHDIVARAERGRGGDIARRVKPTRRDYFVLKTRRSGFLHTPLEVLLGVLEVRRVVLAGIATDMCILATATDAQNRELEVAVPHDCTAALTDERHARALALMRDSVGVEVEAAADIALP
jgi:nicotinamidase-related amidase